MRFLKSWAVLLFLSLAAAHSASANGVSYTGMLSSSTDVFALLLTAGYHLVSLFVQLMAHEYSAVVWHSHF